VTPSRTWSPSRTGSGFAFQAVIDNTKGTTGIIDGSRAFNITTTTSYGFAWGFPEVDPVCGPGSYRIWVAYLALASQSGQRIANFLLTLWTFNNVTKLPVVPIGEDG